jgi:hypothetical protein
VLLDGLRQKRLGLVVLRLQRLPREFPQLVANARQQRPVGLQFSRDYSCRSAVIGSMCEARRAGTKHATAATPTSIRETTATVGR